MSNTLEYKGYTGTVEYSAEDNILFGEVLGIRSLISYDGDSLKSLKECFEKMIDDYLEMCRHEGMEPEKPYSGTINIKVPPELHKSLAVYSMSRNQPLNSTVEEAIKQYVT